MWKLWKSLTNERNETRLGFNGFLHYPHCHLNIALASYLTTRIHRACHLRSHWLNSIAQLRCIPGPTCALVSPLDFSLPWRWKTKCNKHLPFGSQRRNLITTFPVSVASYNKWSHRLSKQISSFWGPSLNRLGMCLQCGRETRQSLRTDRTSVIGSLSHGASHYRDPGWVDSDLKTMGGLLNTFLFPRHIQTTKKGGNVRSRVLDASCSHSIRQIAVRGRFSSVEQKWVYEQWRSGWAEKMATWIKNGKIFHLGRKWGRWENLPSVFLCSSLRRNGPDEIIILTHNVLLC